MSGKQVKLDKIDLKIIKTLQVQARITNQALADTVGLSPSPCLQRVRRLEDLGIIRAYHARIDIERICPRVTVIGTVKLRDHIHEDFLAFEQAVSEIPEIVECSKVSGTFDYLLRFECPSVSHYHELSDRLLAQGPGSIKISSHVVLSHAKEFNGLPLDCLLSEQD